MALLKVPEFAELYGLNRTNVYTYQKRGKLVINEGLIDTNDPINKIWIQKRDKIQSIVKPKKESKPKDVKQPAKPKREITIKPSNEVSKILLEEQYIKIEKQKEDLKAVKIKNDRQLEKLIDKASTGLMINAYLNRFTLNIVQQIEVLIRDSLNEVQATNIQIKKACERLVLITNQCQDIALTEIEKGFNNVVNTTK